MLGLLVMWDPCLSHTILLVSLAGTVCSFSSACRISRGPDPGPELS